MKYKYKCLYELTGKIEDVATFLVPITDLPPQRTWVGLTWNDVPNEWVGKVAFMEGVKWADKQLKEKNA